MFHELNLKITAPTKKCILTKGFTSQMLTSQFVSISPLPKQSIHLTGVAYQEAD
jgi:hypothetical protein